MVQSRWLFCRFEEAPIFALRLDMDTSIRLYAAGFKTVGALDDLIGDYREEELFALLGSKKGRDVLSRLHEFCLQRFHEQMAKENET